MSAPLSPPDLADEHDLGLLHDLRTMRRRVLPSSGLDRRGALRLLAGAAGGIVLAACGSGDPSTASTSTTATPEGRAGTTSTPSGAGSSAGEAVPEETAGPYPGDGSNGPDVLGDSGVVREDLRDSLAGGGVASGSLARVRLVVVDAGSGAPREGAAVYLWHCDAEGRYSMYSSGVTDQTWLRGVQVADADGALGFTTVFPGAYMGRYPHMHYEVFDSVDAIRSGGPIVTSQLAAPDKACAAVYATAGYEVSARNYPQTPITRDGIFADGYDLQMAQASGSPGDITLALTVPV